jgi:hypothetical protein
MARYAIPCTLVMHRDEALRQEKRLEGSRAYAYVCVGLEVWNRPHFVLSGVLFSTAPPSMHAQPSTWPPCELLRASNDHRVTPFLFRYNFYFLHETGFGSQRVHLKSYHYNTFIYIFFPRAM